MYFRIFLIISPWNRMGPTFEQTKIAITQGYFVPRFVEIGPVVLENIFFLNSSMHFHNFVIISP